MRVIQTSNIHLDRSFAALELPPSTGDKCRRHLFDTLRSILARAVEWPADAVVICGDLFDHDRVTRSTVKQLRDTFAALQPVRIFICPGHHDACQTGSPYLTEHWPANVHCFTSPAWETVYFERIPLALHGFGWDRPAYDGGLPPTPNVERANHVHMAFGYGAAAHEDRHRLQAQDNKTPENHLPEALDYLGLGGARGSETIDNMPGSNVHYTGAPVDYDFSGASRREYLEIEVEQPGGPVTVTPRQASEPRLGELTVDCSNLDSGQALIDTVRERLDAIGGISVLRLTLKGELPRQVYAELDGIRDALADSVEYLQLQDTCQLAEDFDAIAQEHTSLGAFIARINTEISDAPTPSIRMERQRSRDLGLCAYRDIALPVRGITGDAR